VLESYRAEWDLAALRAPVWYGFVPSSDLDGVWPQASKLLAGATRLAEQGQDEQALVELQRAVLLAPTEKNRRHLLTTALAARDYPLAVNTAKALTRTRSLAPQLRVSLVRGCRGDRDRATMVELSAAPGGWDDERWDGPAELGPADLARQGEPLTDWAPDMCLTGADLGEPCWTDWRGATCETLGVDGSPEACAAMLERKLLAQDKRRERFAHWRAAVAAVFTTDPRLLVELTNKMALAETLFFYTYTLDASGYCETIEEASLAEVRVVALPLPALAAAGDVRLWLKTEGRGFYGAALAQRPEQVEALVRESAARFSPVELFAREGDDAAPTEVELPAVSAEVSTGLRFCFPCGC